METRPNILEKFTTHLRTTLEHASDFAYSLRHVFLNPEHLLYGLLESRGGIASEILTKNGVDGEALKTFIIARNEPLNADVQFARDQLKLSLPSKRAIEKAARSAHDYEHKYIGTEHLLSGLLELNDPTIDRFFREGRLPIKEIRQQLITIFKSTTKFPDLTGFFEANQEEDEGPANRERNGKGSALDFFATELTDPRLQDDIDPVIGRSEELERLIDILSRRTKNNPVLIGDPGVGKTAIVEGLAKKILQRDVPDTLRNKRVFSLDLSLLIAGTMYRGEFENRLRQVIDEIKADPSIIIFIDELHTIVGTGSASGSMDAANMLKPALAKGQIRCIGATTLDEYRKHIESDAALERRFQPIIVEEPTPEETTKILEGIRTNYERYHRVRITDEAIGAAVRLSVRYLQDKFLPDKAIDLIDEAASKRKVQRKRSPLAKRLEETEEKLKTIEEEKLAAIRSEDYQRAVEARTNELTLRRRVQKIHELLKKEALTIDGSIHERDIADVVARITGIPLADLLKEERERLINLEQYIKRSIVGQDDIITSIAGFIRRSRVGLSHPNRPIASFMFLGPSGVGKTETAKKIAEIVFEDPKALIRIDMSEYGESFQSSKLIGAPAGYVGYKDETALSDQVRRRPYAVILLDEIEKAHPDIFHLFLQVLDEGRITDASGRTVNFKNTIIIMTSNVGVAELNRVAELGFSTDRDGTHVESEYARIRDQVLRDLEKEFRPEFLNRLDEIFVFHPLAPSDVIKIVRLQIDELRSRLTDQQLTLELTPAAEKLIAKLGFKPEYGARAVRRVIQDTIENPLAGKLLEGSIHSGNRVLIGAEKSKITLLPG
jgi:ATP-dependent Clp protease ATP-binding subunit ClpC